eukprot:m.206996 g.206996  ORF g.206996 m.206996 type:complete len:465 (+) comp15439_c0_seq6:2844-4238(+)
MGQWGVNFAALCIICFFGNIAISSTWEPMFELLGATACLDAGFNDTNCGAICTNETAPLREKACAAVADGANRVGDLALVNNGFNFLTIAMCGEISDALGRKKALLISVVGQAGVAMALLFYTNFSQMLVYGVTALFSLGGGQFSFYAAMFSMVADMTAIMSLAERTKYYALLTVLLYTGLCAGPVAIGAVISTGLISVQHSFRVNLVISAALTVMIVLVLAETRLRKSRTSFSWTRSNPLGGMYILSRNKVTIGIAAFQFFLILGSVGVMTIVPVIMLDKGFNSLQTATWQTCLFGALAIGNILLVPIMTKVWGNAMTMRFAGTMFTLFMSMPGLAFNLPELCKPYVLYLFCIPIILGAGWDAPGTSLAVTITGPAYYGITTAGLNSIKCLLQGVTVKIMTTLYAIGKGDGIPWLPFAACAAFNFFGVLCALVVRDNVEPITHAEKSVNPESETTALLSDAPA